MTPWFPTIVGVPYQTDRKHMVYMTVHSAGFVYCRLKELTGMHLLAHICATFPGRKNSYHTRPVHKNHLPPFFRPNKATISSIEGVVRAHDNVTIRVNARHTVPRLGLSLPNAARYLQIDCHHHYLIVLIIVFKLSASCLMRVDTLLLFQPRCRVNSDKSWLWKLSGAIYLASSALDTCCWAPACQLPSLRLSAVYPNFSDDEEIGAWIWKSSFMIRLILGGVHNSREVSSAAALL